MADDNDDKEKTTDEPKATVPKELESILLDFTINVLEKKPSDLVAHAASYFTQLQHEKNGRDPKQGNSKTLESDSRQSISKILGTRDLRRTAIVGEIFDPEKSEVNIEFYPKSEEEKNRIKSLTTDLFIFKHLTEENLNAIIDAMRPTNVKKGQIIIKQNDDGDFFYVIDEGEFATYIEEDGKEKFVMKYENSGSFGELALLHNQPRAATIKALTDGKLWAVSRSTFTKLVVTTAYEKRKRYMELLNKVPELQPLTDYEKMKVCDALTSVSMTKDEVLFKEGDEGNGMFFVEKGAVSISKRAKAGDKELARHQPGDYFGELALVKKQARAGTAKALEDTELAFLDVGAFERLLGPCLDIMKKRADSYKKHKESISV